MSDSVAPREMPSSEIVETSEFTIKVVCEKLANGSRSCKISDIAINDSDGEQPALENPRSDSIPNDSKECGLCEILADMARPVKEEKVLPVADIPSVATGRRFKFENKTPAQDTPEPIPAPRKMPVGRRMLRS